MNNIQRCKPLLGTYVDVHVIGNFPDDELIHWTNIAFKEMERIHHLMGFHHKDSELTQVNKILLLGNEQQITVSDDFRYVLDFAKHLHTLTEGYYDVCVAPLLVNAHQLPNHLEITPKTYGTSADLCLQGNQLSSVAPVCIDLGGIAKGYAVDCAVKKLPETLDVTINAGGDMYQRNWQSARVWLKYAKRSGALKQTKMLNCSLASSGNYHARNLSAIYNPQQALQQKIKGGISVFAPSTMTADALTKAVALLPKRKAKNILKQYQAQAIKVNRFGLMSQL